MTSRDFAYWLQGFFELEESPRALSEKQVARIRAHLALVFKHEIDPSMGDAEHQTELDEIHERVKVLESKPAPFHPDVRIRC